MATVNPRCVICGNAYGTRYICAKCRRPEVVVYKDKDGTMKTWTGPPRAEGWIETSGRKSEGAVEWSGHEYKESDIPQVFEGTCEDYTDSDREVARCISSGVSIAETARRTRLTEKRVRQIRSRFLKGS